VAATSCSIPDGGPAICFAFTSGTTQQNELWAGVFVPATQQTQTTLFEIAPSTDPQFTGVAITNLGNGQLACVGSAQSATAIKYSWATYSSIDTPPSMNTVTVTSANGDPGLFAWHGAPVLFYVDQTGFPYVQKAMALSGPAAGEFPADAGITKYPLGYTNTNGALYIGLASSQFAEVQLFTLP
jgi:hypothetical protein